MSGRITVQMVLVLSALAVTACSDDQTPPLAVSDTSLSGVTVITDESGDRIVRDRSNGVLNEFRIAGPDRPRAITWEVDGKPFVTFDYGRSASGELSSSAQLGLHARTGELVALYDGAAKRLQFPGNGIPTGDFVVNDVDYDEALACSVALSALTGAVANLTWAISAAKHDIPRALTGVFASYALVAVGCNWLLRQAAWEFMNPIVEIGWK